MRGRTFDSPTYRYGFNGKEKDQDGEWGSNTHYDYGFRIYNPGIARFLSVDPLTRSYPMLTPYQFASNNPIVNIDIDGLEGEPGAERMIRQQIATALSNRSGERVDKVYQDLLKEEGDKTGIAGMAALAPLAPIAGSLVIEGGTTAITYVYLYPESVYFMTSVLWGLGTDQDIPGFAGDDFGRAARHTTKGIGILLSDLQNKGNFNSYFSHAKNLTVNGSRGKINCSCTTETVARLLNGEASMSAVSDDVVRALGYSTDQVTRRFKDIFGSSKFSLKGNFERLKTLLNNSNFNDKYGESGSHFAVIVSNILGDGHAFNLVKTDNGWVILDGQLQSAFNFYSKEGRKYLERLENELKGVSEVQLFDGTKAPPTSN